MECRSDCVRRVNEWIGLQSDISCDNGKKVARHSLFPQFRSTCLIWTVNKRSSWRRRSCWKKEPRQLCAICSERQLHLQRHRRPWSSPREASTREPCERTLGFTGLPVITIASCQDFTQSLVRPTRLALSRHSVGGLLMEGRTCPTWTHVAAHANRGNDRARFHLILGSRIRGPHQYHQRLSYRN